MTDQSVREQALQLKYPAGAMGEYRPKDSQTRAHLLSRGWEPHFVMTVRYSYFATANTSCLFLRWGLGESDWAGVMSEGFEAIENDSPSTLFQHQTLAIALVSESTKIETWFEEGRQAALKGEGDGRKCPHDDDYHWFDEYLWGIVAKGT